MTTRITGPDLMAMNFPDLGVADLIESGECNGMCLTAGEQECDCKCRGYYHGRLRHVKIPPSSMYQRSEWRQWISDGSPVSPTSSVRDTP